MQTYKVAVMLVALAGVAAAQAPPQHPARQTIQTTGEATVSVRPDQARMDVGVVTEAPTAEAAASRNAQQVTAALAELKRALAGAGEVRTVGYNLAPVYNYRQNAPPTITGYRASNTVQVVVNDLSRVGPVIDAATRAGANQVQGIQFTLKDEQPARNQALQQAARKARESADALASALGVRVVRILSAQEGAPTVVRPLNRVMAMSAMEGARAPTPVEAGNIEIRAEVTLLLEIQ